MSVPAERLMAFADGALAPDEMASIAAQVAADPALKARVDTFRRHRAIAQGLHADLLTQAPPERLVKAAQARPFLNGRAQMALTGAAIAASFALGFVVSPREQDAPLIARGDAVFAAATLAQALDTQPSGDSINGVRLALTAPTTDTDSCRAFVMARTAGVACSEGAAWRVVALADVSAQADANTYQTAAGELPPSLLSALNDRRVGDALGAEEERAFLQARAKR